MLAETTRVLEICHGCRRCWNLCPSFGNIFKRIDALDTELNGPFPAAAPADKGTGLYEEGAAAVDPSLAFAKDPVAALTGADHDRLVDECYQCKLCFNHCPYHPPHRFSLDFPRLMQRRKAALFEQGRTPFLDRIFARVDWIGRLACGAAPLVNWLNRQVWFRTGLQALAGIHRDRHLPRFHAQTFRQWWDWPGPRGKRRQRVALFYTCSVNYNDPVTAKAAVAVLERNGFEVVCPEQLCCGMPHLDGGDLAAASAAARKNIARLLPLAQKNVPILTLGPTCSYMLKEEYPALLQSSQARLVASMTFDICEYLVGLKRQGRLDLKFSSSPGRVAYQLPCHLKAQNIGTKSKELLELLPQASVSLIERCSAHDGTWSMKTEFFELSMKTAGPLFAEIEAAQAQTVVTDCPLAGLQIEQGTGRPARHPIELVAEAYGLASH